jgi:hypothetical protein
MRNPSGLCQCGCGELAPIADRTFSKRGIFKGESMMYLPNHHGRTHQQTRDHRRTPTYRSWEAMKRRTTAPTSPDWWEYGGAGICLDPRWLRFENFLADMGHRPPGTTLDRIDSCGNYTPGNCRWATATQQLRNRSCVRLSLEIARDIRARYAQGGVTMAALGSEYGVGSGYVSRIIGHDIWREGAV